MIQRFAERLRNAIAEKINRVPLQYFDSHEQGDTLSRVTNDVDLMTQSFNPVSYTHLDVYKRQ